MNEIKMKYQLIVFLYAYLNQIDLSLDRSRWVPLNELREFYKTQIAPEKVVNYLIQKFDLKADRLQYLYFVEGIHLLAKVKGMFLRYFKNESFLTKEEMYYCCQKLLILDQYLKSDLEIHKLEIEKLRIELTKLTYGIIKFKLSIKDRNKVMKIEHFLQNENLSVIKMEEFSRELHM
jgi:hypothetical protein